MRNFLKQFHFNFFRPMMARFQSEPPTIYPNIVNADGGNEYQHHLKKLIYLPGGHFLVPLSPEKPAGHAAEYHNRKHHQVNSRYAACGHRQRKAGALAEEDDKERMKRR